MMPSRVAESEVAARPERDYNAKLLGLIEHSTAACDAASLDATLSLLLLSLMGEFAATGAAIVARSSRDAELIRVGRGSLRRLRIRADSADPAEDLATHDSVGLLVPVVNRGQRLGALALGLRAGATRDPSYGPAEVELTRVVATIASSVLLNYRLHEQLSAANRRAERQVFDLHTLCDVGLGLTAALDADAVFRVVAQTIMAHVLASRSIVLLLEEGATQVAFVRGFRLTPRDIVSLETIPSDAARNAAEVGAPSPYLELLASAGIRDLVPLHGGDGVRGFLGVGARADGAALNPAEIAFLTTLGNQAIATLDNLRFHANRARRERIERELSIARDIQKALLPRELPRLAGYTLAASSEPCYEVGGDYYDALASARGLVLAIGDVSGKSVPAALLMSVVQATIRSLAGKPGETSVSLITTLNRHLTQSTLGNKFVTFFLAHFEPESGVLLYTNAGHNPPILVRANGAIERLPIGGPVLGILDDARYEEGRAELRPGDLLFLYTDGVTEAQNSADEEFGEMRLDATLLAHREQNVHDIVASALLAVREHAAGVAPSDDVTILALKREVS